MSERSPPARRITARAIMIGSRLDTSGLERADAISTNPLAFPVGERGFVVLFRTGVVVLFGLSPVEEDDILRGLKPRTFGALDQREDEAAEIEVNEARDDQIPAGGPISVKNLAAERLLVIADALAKSVAMAHDERGIAKVLDRIEPLAQKLAVNGRAPGSRSDLRKMIGEALLARQRISARIAPDDKPDILWDRPELERLYTRLESEYELSERWRALSSKLNIIDETTRALTGLLDTEHSLRLEVAIVGLIVFEVLITLYELFFRAAK